MLCGKCGIEYPDGFNACPECGAPNEEGKVPSAGKSDKAPKAVAPTGTLTPTGILTKNGVITPTAVLTPTGTLTPTGELITYEETKRRYNKGVQHPPKNIYFWIAKIFTVLAICCFFLPFVTGSVLLINVQDSDTYSGFEYMVEAKNYVQQDDNTIQVDDGTSVGAWITMIILAVGVLFMILSLLLRKGYAVFSAGTFVVYSIFFAIVKFVGGDSSLNHAVKVAPGFGLVLVLILMIGVVVVSFFDNKVVKENLKRELGLV